MNPSPPVHFQIGKQGLTSGIIQAFENAFKTHRQIRISVLKSSGRDKASIQEMAKEICKSLKFPEIYRIIGFTIIINKP